MARYVVYSVESLLQVRECFANGKSVFLPNDCIDILLDAAVTGASYLDKDHKLKVLKDILIDQYIECGYDLAISEEGFTLGKGTSNIF